jgi:hypothetical protein
MSPKKKSVSPAAPAPTAAASGAPKRKKSVPQVEPEPQPSPEDAGAATAQKPKETESAVVASDRETPPLVPSPAVPSPAAAPVAQPPVAAAPAAPKPLELPKGAFVAYRKSGGLRFTSNEIAVYPDGRVTYGGGDTSKTSLTRVRRALNDAQVGKLRRTLDQSGFFNYQPAPGKQSPDTHAMEIVARVGPKHNQVEVFSGDIPGLLTQLIEQLDKLLPADEP